MNTVSGQQYLSLSFNRSLNVTDARYTIQVASLLGEWIQGSSYGFGGDVPNTVSTTQESRTGNATQERITVRDNVPVANSGARFMRLLIALP